MQSGQRQELLYMKACLRPDLTELLSICRSEKCLQIKMKTLYIQYKLTEVLVFPRYLNTKNFTPSFNLMSI
jgi:hypothetical protein